MNAKIFAMLVCLPFFSIPTYAQSTQSIQTPAKAIQKIDLNKADLSVISGSFKGIGQKRAEAIIAYRESHHGFKSLEELAEVKGLGQKFLDKNRDKLSELYSIQ